MYGWLWRVLPGSRAEKAAGMAALALVVLAVLLFFVFPWIEPRLPWNEVTVNSPRLTTPSSAPASPSGSVSPSGSG